MKMRLLSILCFFSIISCTTSDPDWRPLLQSDGLEDFEILNGTATYLRKGNTIIGVTKVNTPNTFLATKEHYGDFELQFDVKIEEGLNSGVQIRSISDPSINDGRVHGYQVEIEDSERGWAAGIYDEARRGWLYPVDRNPSALRSFKKGQWNHYHIIAIGDTLRTWLNGQPVARLVDNMTASGLIGFQVHSIGGEGQANQEIQWKNIQIKTDNVGSNLPAGEAPLVEMIPAVDTSLSEFIIQDGHQLQMLAAEPQVTAPVAADIDPEGNIWVVELPGYMRDIDGSDENHPDGKIVVLSDINGDGAIDRRAVHLDGLVAPRALCLVYGGLLYNDGKILYFQNLRNGATEVVDSTYIHGGNIEHQPNGLYYNLDNWIYSAKSNARYRRINGEWKKDATTIRGQWGMDADLHGRLVYNNNSNGLRGDRVMPNTVIDNPYLEIKALLKNQLSEDQRVYPYQATSLNRGYIPGVLDDEGKLVKFTSVCGPMIYKDPGQWHHDAFVCAPEINAIKQYDLVDKNDPFAQAYKHTYKNKEFLISKDETFRPVNLYNHPKGGFIIVDLRKGVIQHRAYMTSYLREIIKEKKLDQTGHRGRIYRVSEKGSEYRSLKFWDKNISTAELVRLLDHKNGALRLAAQKELVYRDNQETKGLVTAAIKDFGTWGKVHGMWVMEGMNELTIADCQLLNDDHNPIIAYQLLNAIDKNTDLYSGDIISKIALSKSLNIEEIDLQLAHTILDKDDTGKYKGGIVTVKGNTSRAFNEALLSNLDSEFYEEFAMGWAPDTEINEILRSIAKNQASDHKVAPTLLANQWYDNRTAGFELYNKFCLSCHGTDGYGQDGLAPPILNSQYLDGPADKLAAMILQGLHGPIEVSGTTYDMNLVMPGLKHNPDLGDKEISAIISFVNNAFSKAGRPITADQIGKIRKQLGDRMEPLTEDEVFGWKTEE